MTAQKKYQFFQSCWVVDDLHSAMRDWHKTAGVGPFYYVENQVADNYRYLGRPAETAVFSAAFAYLGDTQIELIVQHNDVASAYRVSYPKGAVGHHHLGADVDDYNQALEHYKSKGYSLIHEATYNGQPFCYLDTRAELGFMIELFSWNAASKEFMKMVRDISQNWDGRDPYRAL